MITRARWLLIGFVAGIVTTVRALGVTPSGADLRDAARETLADLLGAAGRLVRPPRRRRLRVVPDR